VRRQVDQQRLVDVVERALAGRVGHRDLAEHAVAGDHRDGEQRPHRRVDAGQSDARRVAAHVVQPGRGSGGEGHRQQPDDARHPGREQVARGVVDEVAALGSEPSRAAAGRCRRRR
jgi:hypothetical protein